MSNSFFSFRQFSISQDRCAMKVGTDGVLLGAWAPGGQRILDVGTGTSLIALMMAQRFPTSHVVGIDIDEESCSQAIENVNNSSFSDRVDVVKSSLQQFFVEEPFDAIVSNPPYFVNSLKNPDARRTLARHTDSLSFEDLFRGVDRLLSEYGVFSVIIPTDALEQILINACRFDFYLSHRVAVKTVERKSPKRYLLSFRRQPFEHVAEEIKVMTDSDGNRSLWFDALTRDFYL
jgi:tRNA1Val (adenine37-N6)-methyltransferase